MPDLRLFVTAFTTIFIAELGDKTQLATLSLAAGRGGGGRWLVLAGASAALICTSVIAVLAGSALTRWVSPVWLRRGAGVLFIALGLLYLFARGDTQPG